MEIKKVKNGIELVSKTSKVLLLDEGKTEGIEGYDIIVGEVDSDDAFVVSYPGEFEIASVSILAQSSKMNEEVNAIEIIMKDISILYTKKDFEYSKLVHDSLGSIDVLITEVDDLKKLENQINKFDPEILIPNSSLESSIVFEKLGITNIEKSKKIKIKSDRFGTDSFILEGVIFG